MSETSVTMAIYQPHAHEMTLRPSTETKVLYLALSRDVWFSLNSNGCDVTAEAEAVDRLAELASEAAAQLRAIAATAMTGGGRP